MSGQDYGVRTGVDACIIDQVADQYAFPEDRSIPALDAVKRDDFRVMLVVVENLAVRKDLCRRCQARDGEPVIGLVDVLRSVDRILAEVED